MSEAFKVFVGVNFKVDGLEELPSADYLSRPDVFYDERNRFVTSGLDRSSWDWYFNYLDFVQTLSVKNATAKPMWILDLGYVPVVYMPSCCSGFGVQLFKALDNKGIPYVKLRPYSFVSKYTEGMDSDGWMSKMDAAKLLNCAPEEVTSTRILKELILDG